MDEYDKLPEQQVILRVPEEIATKIDKWIQQNSGAQMKVDLYRDGSGVLIADGKAYRGKLCSLPSIVETMKTYDNNIFYKSGNVHQVLVIENGEFPAIEQYSNQAKSIQRSFELTSQTLESLATEKGFGTLCKDPSLNSGLTPITRHIKQSTYDLEPTPSYEVVRDVEEQLSNTEQTWVESITYQLVDRREADEVFEQMNKAFMQANSELERFAALAPSPAPAPAPGPRPLFRFKAQSKPTPASTLPPVTPTPVSLQMNTPTPHKAHTPMLSMSSPPYPAPAAKTTTFTANSAATPAMHLALTPVVETGAGTVAAPTPFLHAPLDMDAPAPLLMTDADADSAGLGLGFGDASKGQAFALEDTGRETAQGSAVHVGPMASPPVTDMVDTIVGDASDLPSMGKKADIPGMSDLAPLHPTPQTAGSSSSEVPKSATTEDTSSAELPALAPLDIPALVVDPKAGLRAVVTQKQAALDACQVNVDRAANAIVRKRALAELEIAKTALAAAVAALGD